MSDKSYSSKLARPSPLFIGIDLGTSGCRAVAIDSAGKIVTQANVAYQHKKQIPSDWWLATKTVLQTIASKVKHHHIQAIAVDGTSSTVLLCDQTGKPLTPTVMYDQHHAQSQAEFLQRYAPKNSIVLNSTSSLAKVLWLLEHHKPNTGFHIVHQADWIAGQLCRRFDFSDVNNVLKMGFDPNNHTWPLWLQDLFKQQKISPASLPHVFTPGSVIASIHPQVASDLGLPIDAEIIAGTTDSTAAVIASGINTLGQAVTSIGSTLVLKVISNIEVNAPSYGVYSQPFGKYWLVGGASNSGGAVLQYYFSNEKMLSLTKQLKPETNTGLNYYPLLKKGERFPINDPNLAPHITPQIDNDVVFFQGLLEGIAEIEHTGYKLLNDLGAPYPSSIVTMGGGSVNKAWETIRAHKLKAPINTVKHADAAYGSAKLAAQKNVIEN